MLDVYKREISPLKKLTLWILLYTLRAIIRMESTSDQTQKRNLSCPRHPAIIFRCIWQTFVPFLNKIIPPLNENKIERLRKVFEGAAATRQVSFVKTLDNLCVVKDQLNTAASVRDFARGAAIGQMKDFRQHQAQKDQSEGVLERHLRHEGGGSFNSSYSSHD